jgi:hypothetical protein
VPAADEAFVSLAQIVRAPQAPIAAGVAEVAPAAPAPAPAAPDPAAERDVRLFRARLADAFDVAREALLRECAYAVLGRELLLAPPDIAAIAARILSEHPAAQPLRLRVAPADLTALAARRETLPPLAGDPDLAPGDAVVEFAGGCVDARLGVRIAALLDGDA